jgi:hypothetical protein
MKKVVFTFGRFNPITTGHAKLINKVISVAKSNRADTAIYTSHSHDSNKNPLPYDKKIGFLKKLFPRANIVSDSAVKTIFDATTALEKRGYEEVTLVVGSDRVSEFKQTFSKYVLSKTDPKFDPKKHHGFKFNVVSAGERDPDDDGVSGISASKMREFVRKDDLKSFTKGVPGHNIAFSKEMFRVVKQNLKEEDYQSDEIDQFAQFACDELGIDKVPNIVRTDRDTAKSSSSFASYNPQSKELAVCTSGRHPMDVYRSVAHELVHHKQDLEGRITDTEKEGATGSKIENEANFKAGIIMRNFGRKNPSNFGLNTLAEGFVGKKHYGQTYRISGHKLFGQYKKEGREWHAEIRNTKTGDLLKYAGIWNRRRDAEEEIQSILKREDHNLYESMSRDDEETLIKSLKTSDADSLLGIYKKLYRRGYMGTSKTELIEKISKKVKSYKHYYELSQKVNRENLKESKAIFLIGGPGSGKDFVLKTAFEGHNLTETNFQNILIKSENLIVNGPANLEQILETNEKLVKLGYDTMTVFVDCSNKTSQQRNNDRGKRGGRMIKEEIRHQKWENAQSIKSPLTKIFRNNFLVVENDGHLSIPGYVSEQISEFMNSKPENPKYHILIENETVRNWASKPSTIERYTQKYGEKLAETKILETANHLIENNNTPPKKRTLNEIRNRFGDIPNPDEIMSKE